MGTQPCVLCANCRLLSFVFTLIYGETTQHHLYPARGPCEAGMGCGLQWVWHLLSGGALPRGNGAERASDRSLQGAYLDRGTTCLPLRRIDQTTTNIDDVLAVVDAVCKEAIGGFPAKACPPLDIGRFWV